MEALPSKTKNTVNALASVCVILNVCLCVCALKLLCLAFAGLDRNIYGAHSRAEGFQRQGRTLRQEPSARNDHHGNGFTFSRHCAMTSCYYSALSCHDIIPCVSAEWRHHCIHHWAQLLVLLKRWSPRFSSSVESLRRGLRDLTLTALWSSVCLDWAQTKRCRCCGFNCNHSLLHCLYLSPLSSSCPWKYTHTPYTCLTVHAVEQWEGYPPLNRKHLKNKHRNMLFFS